MAQEGAKIACLGRTESELAEVAGEIEQSGGQAMVLLADVSQPDQMEAAIRQAGGAWGRIDVVVANAGINGVWAPLEDLTPEEWDQTLDINLKGTFLTVKYALPYLKRQGGSVIVVSSVNGTRMFSNTGATAYSCSKAGQLAFAKMTALELAPHKVRATASVRAGSARKSTTTLRRPTSKRCAIRSSSPKASAAYLRRPRQRRTGRPTDPSQLYDASDHITGTEMWIDGGQSLLQGLA